MGRLRNVGGVLLPLLNSASLSMPASAATAAADDDCGGVTLVCIEVVVPAAAAAACFVSPTLAALSIGGVVLVCAAPWASTPAGLIGRLSLLRPSDDAAVAVAVAAAARMCAVEGGSIGRVLGDSLARSG